MRKELALKISLRILFRRINFLVMFICMTTAALADVPQIDQGTNVIMQGSAERERRQKSSLDSSLYFLVGMNAANDKTRTFSDNTGLLSYFQSLPIDVQVNGLWIKRMARTLWTQADADQLSDIAEKAKPRNLKIFTCEPKEPKNGSWLVTWNCSQVSPQSGILSVNCEATESKGQTAKWNCREMPWSYTNPGPMTQEEIARAAQEKLRSRQEKARSDLAILDKKISKKTIGEYKFEVPGSYLLLESFALPDKLRFSVFLQDYGGWTNERISWWGEKDGELWGKKRLAVDVWLDKNVAHKKMIQEVISTPLPTTKVFGLDAYINDFRKTGIKLPVNYSEYTTSVHYVLVGKNGGDHLYMICYAPTPDKKPISGCELYVSSKKGLLIHTWLNESIAPEWLKIGNRINELINSWIVSPKPA